MQILINRYNSLKFNYSFNFNHKNNYKLKKNKFKSKFMIKQYVHLIYLVKSFNFLMSLELRN